MCLVGANRGCKTSLVRSHVRDQFSDQYIVTLGTKVSKKELELSNAVAHARIRMDMMIWDVWSHPGFREALIESYCHGTKGIMAVADMTRRSTLRELDSWIRDVQSVAGPVPVVVLGANREKRDEAQVSEDDVTRVARAHDAPCFFASSSSGEPVEAAFRHLAEAVLQSMCGGRNDRSGGNQGGSSAVR